jgi:hypothetical protein
MDDMDVIDEVDHRHDGRPAGFLPSPHPTTSVFPP